MLKDELILFRERFIEWYDDYVVIFKKEVDVIGIIINCFFLIYDM